MLVTKNRAQVTVTVAGRSLGVWDAVEGGHLTTDAESYQPGGMVKKLRKPGTPQEEEVKVSRYFDSVTDLALHQWLKAQCKMDADASVGKTILNADGTPGGQLPPQSGSLTGVSEPEFDSTSNDEVRVELTIMVVS